MCEYKNYVVEPGEKIREILLERNINISDMSKNTGIARSTIYKLMYEGLDISSYRMAKICKYLNISLDYVMGLDK